MYTSSQWVNINYANMFSTLIIIKWNKFPFMQKCLVWGGGGGGGGGEGSNIKSKDQASAVLDNVL